MIVVILSFFALFRFDSRLFFVKRRQERARFPMRQSETDLYSDSGAITSNCLGMFESLHDKVHARWVHRTRERSRANPDAARPSQRKKATVNAAILPLFPQSSGDRHPLFSSYSQIVGTSFGFGTLPVGLAIEYLVISPSMLVAADRE
jgi:hypothetical protein